MKTHRKIEIPSVGDTVRWPWHASQAYRNIEPSQEVDPEMYAYLEHGGVRAFKAKYPDRTPKQKSDANQKFEREFRQLLNDPNWYYSSPPESLQEATYRAQLNAEFTTDQDPRFTAKQVLAIGSVSTVELAPAIDLDARRREVGVAGATADASVGN